MRDRQWVGCDYFRNSRKGGICRTLGTKPDFGAWLDCRVTARVQAKNGIKGNATNGTRQQDAPVVAGNSNSLVDLSSASDLVNLALNLARRFFVTLGEDVPKTTANTSSGVDPHSNRTGTIIGFKALIWNGRDITDPKNAGVFKNILVTLGHMGSAQDKIRVELHNTIPDVANKFASLTPQESQRVDQIVVKYVQAFSDMDQVAENAFKEIKNKRQWALSYPVDLRDSQGYNQHSIQSVPDWGVTPRLNWTSNVGVDIYDAKKVGRNRNGGSASTEFQFRITEDPKQTQPILFSLSGYGQWLTNVVPTYKVQGKLTIPLGQKTGVSLPISVTYASRIDLIQEAHTEAKFGFTFDAAKIVAALLPSGFSH